jgi:hypothetical protein
MHVLENQWRSVTLHLPPLLRLDHEKKVISTFLREKEVEITTAYKDARRVKEME